MRCKACDARLSLVRSREVAEGVVVEEDLCHKCLRSALSVLEEPDDSDLMVFLEVLDVRRSPSPQE